MFFYNHKLIFQRFVTPSAACVWVLREYFVLTTIMGRLLQLRENILDIYNKLNDHEFYGVPFK